MSRNASLHVSDPGVVFRALGAALVDFVGDHVQNASTNKSSYDDGHPTADHEPKVLLFLFFAFTVGALVRHLLKKTPIPYTVILICIGLVVGAVSNVVEPIHTYTSVARMDPHLLLYVFLPVLIFESAFAMDVHTFKKTVGQSLILAGPGMVVSAVLTSVMAHYIFNYQWSWTVCLLFGTILSATDPVAVVALLKGLGAPVQLGIVIEGESLLNDGAAIVLFNVLMNELLPGITQSGLDIFIYFVRVALGGPLFGWIMGKLTVLWLSHVFNDALIEITITLASTYITFYIGEAFLQVSGVLAVVTLGIEISSRRSNISPEVEKFLHRFWEMLGYLANTLIFILVGVLIAQQAFFGIEALGWMYLVVVYLTLTVIRLFIVSVCVPVLSKIGYSLSWQHAVVISWGGLRGAVGLALALVVVQEANIYPGSTLGAIGDHFLFYTAGIVMLTLIVNATTTEYLLKFLGMCEISNAKKLAMAQAVRRVQEAQQRAMGMLKSDPFLADANWGMVENATIIKDPYKANEEEIMQNKLVARVTQCPQCESEVPRVPHPKELAELAEDARIRTIKAEKTSYWRQFEQGMLGRDAVLVLNSIADTAMDTQERLISLKDIEGNWKVPKPLKLLRSYIEQAFKDGRSTVPPPPSSTCLYGFYWPSINPIVDAGIMVVIVINIVLTLVELAVDGETAQLSLQIINYFFVAFYVGETLMKIIGLRKYYWLSKWNIFDLAITIISVLDTTVLDITVPSIKGINPSIIRVVRLVRVLRILRAGRLVKFMMRLLLTFVDHIINRRLRFGYDIGKGFVVAKEEMLKQLDKLGFAHQEVVLELRERSEAARLDVIRSLGLLRKEHPGVAQSVKTHQAMRSVLNHCMDTVKKMLGSGVLDQNDADKLFSMLEVKMKRLNSTPASLPLPNPEEILRNLAWLDGLDSDVIDHIVQCASLVQFECGDSIHRDDEMMECIYVIVSGLVKVFKDVPLPLDTTASAHSLTSDKLVEKKTLDLLTSGNVIGEKSILTGERTATGTSCETDVQAFMITASKIHEVLEENPIIREDLWRVCGIRIAANLLLDQPEYQDWTSIKISLLCEDAFVVYPPEGPAPTFEITDKHEAVIVLHGKARCVSTREKLIGPCIVPRNINHILLDRENTVLLVIPKLGSGEELKKRAEKKKNESSRMKTKKKPYLRMVHFVRDSLSQCLQRWQGRKHRVVPGARDDIEHGLDLDQEQQQEMAEMECLSSDFPLVGTSEAAAVSANAAPCVDIVPPVDTPIMQVVGEPGVQAQYDLSSLSSELELPPTVPGTPVQSA